jgi:phosphoglycerate dehydrogenase-like enzyme
MTPHYSGATREARERALAAVGRNLRHLIDGEPIENAVDIERGF